MKRVDIIYRIVKYIYRESKHGDIELAFGAVDRCAVANCLIDGDARYTDLGPRNSNDRNRGRNVSGVNFWRNRKRRGDG